MFIYLFCRNSGNDSIIWHIFDNNRIRCYYHIISYHNFEKTPELNELTYIVEKEKQIGDIAKVAVMPEKLGDTLVILAILSRFDDTIAISMGELGSYTRVMASKFNSPITFAAGRDVTAPGQLDIETMKMLLNMDIMDDDELDDIN